MAEPAHRSKDAGHAAPTLARAATTPGVESPESLEPADSRDPGALLADPRLASNGSVERRTRLVQGLQRGAGNAYVARLIQRAVADAPASPKLEPRQDPKFIAVEQKIGQTAHQEKAHPSAKSKAAEAQGAAQGPPNDVASQAAAAQTDKMAQQKPGEFDKKAFIDAVKKAIDAAAPKNLEEADDFKKSNKAGEVKGEVSGLVGKGKQDSESGIKAANTEAPDASGAKPKLVKPMGEEKLVAAPGDAGAAKAIPSPKPASETSMAAGPAEVKDQMAQANVTDEQLKKSNEPEFNSALDAKQTAEQNSQQAPQDYKGTENQTLAKAGGDAKASAASNLGEMHADKAQVLGAITAHKGTAKAQDEAKRAEVATKIETIFNQTRADVKLILDGLDAKVNTAFEAGEKAARDQFESYVEQRMKAYKDKRYSLSLEGAALWVKDKVMGMPSEVNAFYQDGRNQYLKQMEGVISKVADLVGGELGRAKARIAQGRQQVKDFVASQPKELQKLSQDAADQMGSKFDELEGEVNQKQDALVQTLADKYVAARDALDDRINQLKAENKGLVDAAKEAIGGVIQTIKNLKDMLLGVLQKAANVIDDIIKDPIKFLGNLVGAIKQGLNQFVANIGTHLKKALMGWLFGTLGDAGLQLPDSFDLKGILSIVLQVLGLTYENIRAIAVKIAGEKVVAAVEGTVKFFMTLAKDGPAGLWQWIKDKIDQINIKDMVIGAIKDFVITKIIVAGVSWLIGLLNPAAAFIKACKMIYDVIMFFIERGSQIMEFVNSVLDGMAAIVAGSLGPAANLVENSLAKILPLAISFLASLLGVGGIAEKIKEIIEKIRAPINKLVTAVITPILRPLKKLYDKGAKFVKGAIDKGKALGQNAVGKVKSLLGGGRDKSPASQQPTDARTGQQKQSALASARADIQALLTSPSATLDSVKKGLPIVKERHGLTALNLVPGEPTSVEQPVEVKAAIDSELATISGNLKSGDVKEAVHHELEARLPKVIKDRSEVEPILKDVYAKYQPGGLKSLQVLESKQDPTQFEVEAIASPGKRVGAFAQYPDLELEDLDLDWGTKAFVTVHSGTNSMQLGEFWAQNYPRPKTAPDRINWHAESSILQELSVNWPRWFASQAIKPGVETRIEINITRTPCPSCMTDLMNWAASHSDYKVVFDIKSMTFHYGGGRGTANVEQIKAKMREFMKQGHKISGWDVLQELGVRKEDMKNEGMSDLEARYDRRFNDLESKLKSLGEVKVGSG
jgi:hypothetical protein